MTALLSCLSGAVLGCGAPAAPDRHADPAAVRWADTVCGGVAAGSAKLGTPPALGAGPASDRDAMVGFLDRLGSALDDMGRGLTTAGRPPVPNAESTVDKAAATLRETRSRVSAVRAQMARAEVTDRAGLARAVSAADTTMNGLSDPGGPVKDLKTDPGLRPAFDESAVCRRVYGSGS
ncbi:hypothetical protein [Amycolatopsis sp. PS_44_ISF1]|uniref:hypothetical protein n=1 Tax=Amycolatopsis sp. PS_44_ISF1 TaxID=2974917 RepID=UPI0028DF27FB|nr:hypothetical protein [Amycolatopsis sp. PS_44_ISF1]MDT8912961.1 hypothetical protein [Amycolatopsis sp. PS_44_ISF1]